MQEEGEGHDSESLSTAENTAGLGDGHEIENFRSLSIEEDIAGLDVSHEIERATSPVLAFFDSWAGQDQFTEESAVEKIQAWWRGIRRIMRVLRNLRKPKFMTAMKNLIVGDGTNPSLLHRLKDDTISTERAVMMTSNVQAGKDAVVLLLKLPRDKYLRQLGDVSLHGPRAFLAALLVSAKPSAVLGDDHATIHGRRLRNASRMLVLSLRLLLDSIMALDPTVGATALPPSGNGERLPPLRRFRTHLIMVRWSRRYHAASMKSWKKHESLRVADSLMGPCAECFKALFEQQRLPAENQDETLIATATQQLSQIKAALSSLIGDAIANAKFQEIEATVKQQLQRAESYVASRRTVEVEQDGVARTPQKNVSEALRDLLVNEQLAHELTLDPEFELPASVEPPVFTAPDMNAPIRNRQGSRSRGAEEVTGEELAGRVQSVVQEIFWQRLTTALTPVPHNGPEDLLPGAIAQIRGPDGSYYVVEVLSVNDDGSRDVRYLDDRKEEQRVPLSRFRLKESGVDVRTLVALVEQLRQRLCQATPRRTDLHAQYAQALDTGLVSQMLQHGALDIETALRLFHFVLERLEFLQGPGARAERTKLWRQGLDAYAARSLSNQEAIQSNLIDGRPAPTPIVALLPVFFTFVFATLDELQRDIANVKMRSASLLLQRGKGATYERELFDDKLREGVVTLEKTKHWLSAHARRWVLETPHASTGNQENGASDENLYASRRRALGEKSGIEACAASAIVALLDAPVRLDSVDAVVPETLAWDSTRLARLRDSQDRVVLVATLIATMRQVLATKRVVPNAEALESLHSKLDWLLQQQNTRLPSLQRAVLTAAEKVSESSAGDGLGPQDLASLEQLITQAVNADNPVFKLYSRRARDLLATLVLGGSFDQSVFRASGLGAFKDQILTTAKSLRRLVHHNVAVFSPRYSEILSDVASTLTSVPPASNE